MTVSEMSRPSLNDLIKVAMETSAAKIDLSLETARQLGNAGEPPPPEAEKTAAAEDDIPPEYIDKLAAGCLYLAKEMDPKVATVDFPGTENELGPGKGPNASDVSAAQSEEQNIAEAGQMGKATDANTPPLNPPTQKDPTRSAGPDNQLQTNDDMSHPEQGEEPIKNEKASLSNESVKASAAYVNNLIAVGLAKVAADESGEVGLVSAITGQKLAFTVGDPGSSPPKAPKRGLPERKPQGPKMTLKDPGKPMRPIKGGKYAEATPTIGAPPGQPMGGKKAPPNTPPPQKPITPDFSGMMGAPPEDIFSKLKEKKGSVNELDAATLHNLKALGLSKQAEDAIAPASISGGAAPAQGATPPPGAAPSEEGIPPEPSDVDKQKNKMLQSNQAAIDYTKKDAKGDPITDVNQVLNEPAMSAAHDKTLNKVLDHTQEAGAKISSAMSSAIRKIASGKARKAAQGGSPEAAAMNKLALLGALPGASEAPTGQKLPGAISGSAGSAGGALAGGLGGAGVGAGLGGLAGAGLGALGGLAFGGDPSQSAMLGGKIGLGAGALGGAGLGGYYGAGKGYEAAMRPYGEIEALRGQNIAMKDWIQGAHQAGMDKGGSANFGDLSGRTLAHAMAKVAAPGVRRVAGIGQEFLEGAQDVAQAGKRSAPKMPSAAKAPAPVHTAPRPTPAAAPAAAGAPAPVQPGIYDEAVSGANMSPDMQGLHADLARFKSGKMSPQEAAEFQLRAGQTGVKQQHVQRAQGQVADEMAELQSLIEQNMASGMGREQAVAAAQEAVGKGMGTGTALAVGGGLGIAGLGGAGLAAGAMDEGEYPISPGYTSPYVGAVEKKYPTPGKYASANPLKMAAARAVVSKLGGKKEKRSAGMPTGAGASGGAGTGEQAGDTGSANMPSAASPPGM